MHHYFMCHYEREKSDTKKTVTQFFLILSTVDSSEHRDVQMCISESVKCNASHHSHTITNCVILEGSLKPPDLFLQLETCGIFIICKIPLWCKNSIVPDLWFSPRTRIFSGPETF